MKRHPSKRARTKFSESADAADPQQSVIDRSEGRRRKTTTEAVDPAATEPPFSSEWDDNGFEVVGPPPRR